MSIFFTSVVITTTKTNKVQISKDADVIRENLRLLNLIITHLPRVQICEAILNDNLNGAQVLGRVIRVDHCGKYVKREEEDEETQRQNREARGVCRAFQRGECTRGDSCKFSHDEKRAANTGWGHEDDRSSRLGHDKFSGAKKGGTSFGHRGDFKADAEEKSYREKGNGDASNGRTKERERVEREDREPRSRDAYDRREQKRSGRPDDSQSRSHKTENDYIREEKRSRTHDWEKLKAGSRGDHNDRDGKGSSRQSGTSTRQEGKIAVAKGIDIR